MLLGNSESDTMAAAAEKPRRFQRSIDVFLAMVGGPYTFEEGEVKFEMFIPPQVLCKDPRLMFDIKGFGRVLVEFNITLPDQEWYTEDRRKLLEDVFGRPSPPPSISADEKVYELEDLTPEQEERLEQMLKEAQ